MGMPVTVKGQVTIPKPIRDRLALTPGSRVEFEVDDAGRVILRKADAGRRMRGGTALHGSSAAPRPVSPPTRSWR
jgi:AbrB family looped-hinge helix DNA binding protein